MTDDQIDRSEGESVTDGLDAVDRRTVVRALGAATTVGALGGGASGTTLAQSSDWESRADQRIRENQQGTIEVRVQDQNGSPVSGATVDVEMTEHDFGFGTAINADTLLNQSSPGDNYRTYIPELFNKVVFENHMKWRFWENHRSLVDDAVSWLLDNDLTIRGHVCIWGRPDVNAIPPRINTAIDNNDGETIRQESMAHIREIIEHFGEDIEEWEVYNEAMHVYQLQLGYYGDQIDTEEPWTGDVVPWTSGLLADWYSHAQSVIDENGYDVDIAVNDFNQFAWDYADDRYQTEIEHINSNGAQLDGIGLQGHVRASTNDAKTNDDPDGRLSYDQIVNTLDMYTGYGADIKITEFDMYGGDDWGSTGQSPDEERADVMRRYLKAAYGHPAVSDFLMWGFWDGRHWENEAPLFDQNWNRKPAYDVWDGLVFDEWWTSESGTTGSQGTFSADAFLGTHEISVNDGEATTTVEITDPSTERVTVTVAGDGVTTTTTDGTGGDTPGRVGDNANLPADPDGDGLYEDVNGNDRQGIADAVDLFQNRESVDAEFFDFNESGGMSIGDAVSLFRENT